MEEGKYLSERPPQNARLTQENCDLIKAAKLQCLNVTTSSENARSTQEKILLRQPKLLHVTKKGKENQAAEKKAARNEGAKTCEDPSLS